MTNPTFDKLEEALREITDLQAAAALLEWDQQTYMPPGGAPARARQLATLEKTAHSRLVSDDIGKLLDDLKDLEAAGPYDAYPVALIRLARRRYDRARKIPPDFAAELTAHNAATYHAWTKARPANDFATIQPYLERNVELSRQWANYIGDYERIADPLIEAADFGMTTSRVETLFAELRQQLVPLVQAIAERPPVDTACLHQHFPADKQRAFGEHVVKHFGYDFTRGRQDKTHHPFMIGFSINDVRITTRFKEDDLSEALFSTMHEAGHALYELGIDPACEGTLLAHGASSAVHESQSRLWENLVGRSRPFWNHFYPQLQQTFPDQLATVDLDTFYHAINAVAPSLIRTDADEVTYNLHVMIRFQLGLDLLEGRLAVADLPDAWRAAYQRDLGITPPDDKDGVLQDVHWFSYLIGGNFQCYTLGNIMNAQFFAAALRAHPDIPTDIEKGRFDTLRTWLQQNIHRHGSTFTADELIQQTTNQPLSVTPYIQYLHNKYTKLYDL